MNKLAPRILSLGYQVPANVRTNCDSIFDWLKAHPRPRDPFYGFDQRRVLGEGEDLMTIMIPASLKAINAAKLHPADIDILLGCGSVSPYGDPNELCRLHQQLHLPSRAWTVPLNNEFSNFNAGLLLADSLIRAGRARNVLVTVGGNWSRHVDYHTVQAVSAADGAGSAVVGLMNHSGWEVIDHETITRSEYFGTMYMEGDRYPQLSRCDGHSWLWSDPYFHITFAGFQGLEEFGVKEPPAAVKTLLSRNNLCSNEVTLIAHQATQKLLDAWKEAIRPAKMIHTIKKFANMTVANLPVNFAWAAENNEIAQENLVLLGLGPDMHANALLLRQTASV